MQLLAAPEGRSRFQLTYSDLMSLPIGLKDQMIEQLRKWRSEEDAAANKHKG